MSRPQALLQVKDQVFRVDLQVSQDVLAVEAVSGLQEFQGKDRHDVSTAQHVASGVEAQEDTGLLRVVTDGQHVVEQTRVESIHQDQEPGFGGLGAPGEL